ncbi:MAG: metal-dependent hydrolase [Gemmatimonadales bacterium]
MDNFAHALVGAALGRAVADQRIPRPALLGAIAANAPDWTEIFVGLPAESPRYLAVHRGITHSLLGVLVQIIGLTALVAVGWALSARRRGGGVSAAAGWPWVLACVAVTVLSHPIMDWQGSYGARPFLPWSGRWVYGDFVAIVDPFYWLIPLTALAWGAPRHWRPALVAAAVGLPATAFVVLVDVTATWVRIACLLLLGLGVAGWIGHWFGVAQCRRAAVYAVALLAVYAGAQGAVSLPVKAATRREAHARFGAGAQWAALTQVGRPFTWERVYASADTVAGRDWRLPRRLDHPVVRRAVQTVEGRAMAHFARLLVAEIASDSATVYLMDARYARDPRAGFGVVSVRAP